MASSKQKEQQTKDTPQEPPAGFQRGGTPDIDGWYKPEPGVVVHGQLVGHIEVPGRNGPRSVVCVKLTSPCVGYQKGDQEGLVLPPDSILGVSVSHDLRGILDYVEHHGMCWFRATEKKNLSGGNTMWKFDQYYKGKKAALVRTSSDVSDDDIPF